MQAAQDVAVLSRTLEQCNCMQRLQQPAETVAERVLAMCSPETLSLQPLHEALLRMEGLQVGEGERARLFVSLVVEAAVETTFAASLHCSPLPTLSPSSIY
jgi:hypothetical protein